MGGLELERGAPDRGVVVEVEIFSLCNNASSKCEGRSSSCWVTR